MYRHEVRISQRCGLEGKVHRGITGVRPVHPNDDGPGQLGHLLSMYDSNGDRVGRSDRQCD